MVEKRQDQLKVEEEEDARKREAARQKAFYLKACFSKLDELLTKTQLYSKFLLEKMDQITDKVVEVKDEEEPIEELKKGGSRTKKEKYKTI